MTTQEADLPISKELLDILRCPLAVQSDEYGDDPGRLELVHNCWLVSADSGLKYPIRDGIPVMLIDEGMKWKDVAVEDLPVPPPAETSAPVADTTTRSTSAATESKEKVIALKPAQLAIVLVVVIGLIVLLKKRRSA